MESNLKIFGNPSSFAIQFLPIAQEYHYEHPEKYAFCHLVVKNVIIGDPDEECYLSTWYAQLKRNRTFIWDNKNNLYPETFVNLTDREIFEIIIKSNEPEEDFDNNFRYLPQLKTEVWRHHTFHLDETTDAYLMCFYIHGKSFKFIIEKKWPESKVRDEDNFIFTTINIEDFF